MHGGLLYYQGMREEECRKDIEEEYCSYHLHVGSKPY
jgi:hypothetical protein